MTDDSEQPVSISVVGLPGSGKTTFLAALWELVQEIRVEKVLRFHSIGDADHSYLRQIVRVWRSAREQARTFFAGLSEVRMRLQDSSGRVVNVLIPDAPGEEFRSMWEERGIGIDLGHTLGRGSILLLLNGNKIKAPAWITEREALRKAADAKAKATDEKGKVTRPRKAAPVPKEWDPRFAPTQVPLIELLQQVSHEPIGERDRRLVIMISAWDKVEGELLSPAAFLAAKLPMLDQYLAAGRDCWEFRVYGVSAQGGEYDENDENREGEGDQKAAKLKLKKGRDAQRLLNIVIPSDRIRLIHDGQESNDLTEPLRWLMN